ncbi:dienelactone hydrolase family protein [Edaphobacter modestus]|uniref:Dienelactone hydrolase n=1 Tax=Edaphobacter modestus TaxID=388466 RepID=A0A4Q7YVP4_9BACT|nr:alpha/beta fold hydrolase [Edaphobacter modestus]RZU41115.1 dienelactone hydrolase [Edaphobacter modestus]
MIQTLAVLICSAVLLGASAEPGKKDAAKGTQEVTYENFGVSTGAPLMILLHGASGPSGFNRQQSKFFAEHGFRVVLPHYLEATHNSSAGTDENYAAWVTVVRNLMNKLSAGRSEGVVLVGFSLGASVALAVGSQGQGPDAIAEWYGSLPDKFFRDLKGMPPLLILHGERDTNIPVMNARQLSKLCLLVNLTCETHIYPDQEHGFDSETVQDADRRTLQFLSKYLPAKRSVISPTAAGRVVDLNRSRPHSASGAPGTPRPSGSALYTSHAKGTTALPKTGAKRPQPRSPTKICQAQKPPNSMNPKEI